jgi:hypothetical protein
VSIQIDSKSNTEIYKIPIPLEAETAEHRIKSSRRRAELPSRAFDP